jgi:hypothetical protein
VSILVLYNILYDGESKSSGTISTPALQKHSGWEVISAHKVLA